MTSNIPKNLEEAFKVLKTVKGLEDWTNDTEKSAIANAHHGLGMWIRNNWGLWAQHGDLYKHFIELGIYHADDMSSIILISFHRHMNNKDIDIMGQVTEYEEFWLASYLSDQSKVSDE